MSVKSINLNNETVDKLPEGEDTVNQFSGSTVPEDFFGRLYAQLEAAYHEQVSDSIQAKVSWICDKGSTAWSFMQKGKDIVAMARFAGLAAEESLSKVHVRNFSRTSVISLIALPVQVTNFIRNTYSFTLSCFNKDKGKILLEKSLTVVSNLGDILDSIGTFIFGLQHFAIVAEKSAAIAAATHIVGLSMIFSVASMMLQGKQWYETARLKKRLFNDLSKNSDFKAIFEKLQKMPSEKLAKKIGVSKGEKLKNILRTVWNNNSIEGKEEENLLKVSQILKNRFFSKELSHGLKILVTLIGLIGAVMTLTPVAPVGFGLLVAACVMGIFLEIFDFSYEKYFFKCLSENLNNKLT